MSTWTRHVTRGVANRRKHPPSSSTPTAKRSRPPTPLPIRAKLLRSGRWATPRRVHYSGMRGTDSGCGTSRRSSSLRLASPPRISRYCISAAVQNLVL
eukprot:3433773-Rhodomonas_salina.1